VNAIEIAECDDGAARLGGNFRVVAEQTHGARL
jgi:hypothetical protein